MAWNWRTGTRAAIGSPRNPEAKQAKKVYQTANSQVGLRLHHDTTSFDGTEEAGENYSQRLCTEGEQSLHFPRLPVLNWADRTDHVLGGLA